MNKIYQLLKDLSFYGLIYNKYDNEINCYGLRFNKIKSLYKITLAHQGYIVIYFKSINSVLDFIKSNY